MSPQPRPSVRARWGTACVTACLIATGGAAVAVAPASALSASASAPATERTWTLDPIDSRADDEVGEPPGVPAPGETTTPTPAPEPTTPPTATPTPTPAPTEPSPAPTAEPQPPAEGEGDAGSEPVAPPRVESEVRGPVGAAARFGALLRLEMREAAPSATPAPGDEVHLDGGPDVGGAAELSASVAPESATGRTDAVQVGALDTAAATGLAHPVVWAPWAGALGVAAVAVLAVLVRGGRQNGR